MAAGDVSLDADTIGVSGNLHTITGTVEVSTTAAEAQIVPNGYVVSFVLMGNDDDVDVSLPRIALNASDFSATAANGSVYIDGSGGAPDSVRFECKYIA